MYNFFTDNQQINGKFYITGGDYNHIKNVLRMKKGEQFLVSQGGVSHLCELEDFENESVIATILEENYQDTSLPIEIHLFLHFIIHGSTSKQILPIRCFLKSSIIALEHLV